MKDTQRPWPNELRQAVHVLGSPLAAIRVLVEVLRLTDDDAERKVELLEMMESQVDELAVGLSALTKYFTHVEDGGAVRAGSAATRLED